MQELTKVIARPLKYVLGEESKAKSNGYQFGPKVQNKIQYVHSFKGEIFKARYKALKSCFWGFLPLYNFDVLPPSSWLEILFLRALVSQTLETC